MSAWDSETHVINRLLTETKVVMKVVSMLHRQAVLQKRHYIRYTLYQTSYQTKQTQCNYFKDIPRYYISITIRLLKPFLQNFEYYTYIRVSHRYFGRKVIFSVIIIFALLTLNVNDEQSINHACTISIPSEHAKGSNI